MMEKPILGYGPENFNIPFDKHYSGLSAMEAASLPGSFFDKAHNFLIEIGTTTGILGLLAFFSVWFAVFWMLFRQKAGSINYFDKSILIASIIAYFVQDLFNIDTISSFIYIYLLFALTVFVSAKNIEETENPVIAEENVSKNKKIFCFFTALVLIPLSLFSIKEYNIDFLRANYLNNLANQYFQEGNYDLSFQVYEKGIQKWSYLSHDLCHKYASALSQYATTIRASNPEKSKESATKALELINKAAKEQPHFNRSWILGGVISTFLIESGYPSFQKEADYYFEKAVEMSGNRSFTWVNWGKEYILLGDYKTAKQKIAKAHEIYPDGQEPYFMLGIVNIYENNPLEAAKFFALANKMWGDSDQSGFDPHGEDSLLQKARAYQKINDLVNLEATYGKLKTRYSQNFQYWFGLANTQKQMGKFAEARKTIEDLIKIYPQLKDNKSVNDFLNTLQ